MGEERQKRKYGEKSQPLGFLLFEGYRRILPSNSDDQFSHFPNMIGDRCLHCGGNSQ